MKNRKEQDSDTVTEREARKQAPDRDTEREVSSEQARTDIANEINDFRKEVDTVRSGEPLSAEAQRQVTEVATEADKAAEKALADIDGRVETETSPEAAQVLAKLEKVTAACGEVEKELAELGWKDEAKLKILRTLGGAMNLLDRLRDLRFQGTEHPHVPDRLFISYSHANSALAEKLVSQADEKGVRTWFDKRHLVGSTRPYEAVGEQGTYRAVEKHGKGVRGNFNDAIQLEGVSDSSHAAFLITPEGVAKFDEIRKEIEGAIRDKNNEPIFVFAGNEAKPSGQLRADVEKLLANISDPRVTQALQKDRSIELANEEEKILPKILDEINARAKADEADFARKKQEYREKNVGEPINAIDSREMFSPQYQTVTKMRNNFPGEDDIHKVVSPEERQKIFAQLEQTIRQIGQTLENQFATYKPQSAEVLATYDHEKLAEKVEQRLTQAGVAKAPGNKADALVVLMSAKALKVDGFDRTSGNEIYQFLKREQKARTGREYMPPVVIPVWTIERDSAKEIKQIRTELERLDTFGDYMALTIDSKDAQPGNVANMIMDRAQLEAKYLITRGVIDAAVGWDYNRIKRNPEQIAIPPSEEEVTPAQEASSEYALVVEGLEEVYRLFAKKGQPAPSFEGYAEKLSGLSEAKQDLVDKQLKFLQSDCLRDNSAQPVVDFLEFIDKLSAK